MPSSPIGSIGADLGTVAGVWRRQGWSPGTRSGWAQVGQTVARPRGHADQGQRLGQGGSSPRVGIGEPSGELVDAAGQSSPPAQALARPATRTADGRAPPAAPCRRRRRPWTRRSGRTPPSRGRRSRGCRRSPVGCRGPSGRAEPKSSSTGRPSRTTTLSGLTSRWAAPRVQDEQGGQQVGGEQGGGRCRESPGLVELLIQCGAVDVLHDQAGTSMSRRFRTAGAAPGAGCRSARRPHGVGGPGPRVVDLVRPGSFTATGHRAVDQASQVSHRRPVPSRSQSRRPGTVVPLARTPRPAGLRPRRAARRSATGTRQCGLARRGLTRPGGVPGRVGSLPA